VYGSDNVSCRTNCRRLLRRAHSIPGWVAVVLVPVLALARPPMAFADDHYTLTDLGGKQWTDKSIAEGINAAGQVVATVSPLNRSNTDRTRSDITI